METIILLVIQQGLFWAHTKKEKKICVLSFISTYTVLYYFDILKNSLLNATTKQILSNLSFPKKKMFTLPFPSAIVWHCNTHIPTANIQKFHIAIDFCSKEKGRYLLDLWQIPGLSYTPPLISDYGSTIWGSWERIEWKDRASTWIEWYSLDSFTAWNVTKGENEQHKLASNVPIHF